MSLVQFHHFGPINVDPRYLFCHIMLKVSRVSLLNYTYTGLSQRKGTRKKD